MIVVILVLVVLLLLVVGLCHYRKDDWDRGTSLFTHRFVAEGARCLFCEMSQLFTTSKANLSTLDLEYFLHFRTFGGSKVPLLLFVLQQCSSCPHGGLDQVQLRVKLVRTQSLNHS